MNLTEALQERQVDMATIAQIRQLESIRPGVLLQLVSVFERSALTSLARIRQSLLEGDAEQLRLTLHSLKGTTGSLGARRLSALVGVFEAEGQASDAGQGSTRLNALTDVLEQEFLQVLPQLQALGRQAAP